VVSAGNQSIYAQVIDDSKGVTLAGISTSSEAIAKTIKHGGNVDAAKKVGLAIAKAAIAKGVKKVVFDRNGNLYHGRIKALADSAREGGLEF
jgi:large subunit ribosomal protein L18